MAKWPARKERPVPSTAGTVLPLEGIRVLDFTLVLAGPYGTMLLADLGAEVIRVESPRHFPSSTRGAKPRPEPRDLQSATLYGRAYPGAQPGERPWNRYGPFNSHARNKLAITLDFGKHGAQTLVRRLVAESDVVVENNAPGVMKRLGLGFDELRSANPEIIMVSSSALGATGPLARLRGFGGHIDAMTGHLSMRGYPDTDPSAAGNVVISDAAAGPAIAFATLAALIHRDQTGEGQHIDMSQAENLMHYFALPVFDYSMNGRIPTPTGNRHEKFAPQSVYRCRGDDQWIALTVRDDSDFAALCRVLRRPDLVGDVRFADSAARYRNQTALDPIIEERTSQEEARVLFDALQREGVPAGILLNEADAYSDPHLAARGFFESVQHPDAGTHRYPGMLWRQLRRPLKIRRYAPRLGEDNAYVYRDILGLSAEEYVTLEALGHVTTEYLPPVVEADHDPSRSG